jgi:hypothetical protein
MEKQELQNVPVSRREKPEAVMDWMEPKEIAEIMHVEDLRNEVIKAKGLLDPVPNIQALNWMTHYFARNSERLGKYEAMQREHFADLLIEDDKMTIGKAEALSKGSDFGKRRAFYEHLCAGYLEMINTLKKTQEYWQKEAKNQF